MYCSPARENQKLTCFSKDSLVKIAKSYNQQYHSNIIKYKGKTKFQIWRQIREAMSNRCSQEICWVDQDFVKSLKDKEITQETFRPKMPKTWKKNLSTWLTTDDINEVMIQYEDIYPDFLFIGPIPIDCQIGGSLRCELQKFDIAKAYKNGLRRLGIVVNSDLHSGIGIHWFCIYAEMAKNGDISFYDSYGEKPDKYILNIMEKMQKNLKKVGLDLKMQYNRTRHQYDGFNCGVYSMNYIINRLKGKTHKQMEKKKIPSKIMQEMKHYLYRS